MNEQKPEFHDSVCDVDPMTCAKDEHAHEEVELPNGVSVDELSDKQTPKTMHFMAQQRGLKRVKSKRAGTAAAERYDTRWNDQDEIEAEHVISVYPDDSMSRADLKWELDRGYVIFGDEERPVPAQVDAPPEEGVSQTAGKKARRSSARRQAEAAAAAEILEEPAEVYDFDAVSVEDLN